MNKPLSVVMLGATGAVGSEAAKLLAIRQGVERLTLLGRRPLDGLTGDHIEQHRINIFETDTYKAVLPGHQAAICTLGVGQPSKVSKEDFVKIDKQAVLDFAAACHSAGVQHFELLSSVGASSRSSSFFLRTKGELQDALIALNFERLSLFQPSMILTPTNRYGFSQAVTLKVWPWLTPVLAGPLRKFRGVRVEKLGQAMANNLQKQAEGVKILQWDDF